MLTALAPAAIGAPSAKAQSSRNVHLDLSPGTVSTALRMIANQTGASFGTDQPDLLRRRTGRLRIDLPEEKAIDAVLARTGLIARRVAPRIWRIEISRAAPSPPPPIRKALLPVPPREAEEILVTGSKLNAPITGYPASVTILDGSAIDHAIGDHGTLAIAALHPTLLSTRLGSGRNKLFLRGISDSSFSGASPSLVGQYLGDQRLVYASPDPDLRLYDIARVEIFEGPQGSLYGAGSLGGVLRIIPNAPDTRQQSTTLWGGITATDHGAMGSDTGLIANLPLSDRSAIRFLGYRERAGGYIDDVKRHRSNINAGEIAGARLSIRMPLGDKWSMDLAGVAQDVRNMDAQYEERALRRLVRASSLPQPSHHFYRALTASFSGPIGTAHLQSSWGIVDQRLAQIFDATQVEEIPEAYRQFDHIRLLSNETRLTRQFGPRWEAVVGIAALRSISRQERMLGPVEQPSNLGTLDAKVSESTLFGEVRWHPRDTLTLSAGGRASRIDMHGSAIGVLAKPAPDAPPVTPTRRQSLSTPTIALAWTPVRRATLYARYAGSYRPGGFTVGGAVEKFEPDTVRTAEVGFRIKQPDDSTGMGIEGSLARTKWHNIQADTVDALGLPHTANLGDGVVRTATLKFSLSPVRGVTAVAGGFIASTRLVANLPEFEDAFVSHLPNVARHGAILSLAYEGRVSSASAIRAELRGHSVGRSMLGIGPRLQFQQGDYTYFSGSLGWEIGRTTLSLEMSNLLDTRGNMFALGTPFSLSSGVQGTPLRPGSVRLALLVRAP